MSSSAAQFDNAIAALPPLKLFIGGQWVDSDSNQRIDVVNPATGELLASIPHASARDVDRAVESARKAWDGWRLTPPFERAAACHRIADRILARKEQIATVISLEQGKPYLAEALPEVEESAENFRIAAEDVKRLETPIIPARDPNKRLFTFKVAIGTWGIITPWNFPTVIPSEYFGPGLAAGNTIVFKPAEQTPLAGLLLTQCIAEAGLPLGVFNLVCGDGPTTGDALVAHPGIDGIGLTGETTTGDTIQRRAGVKKLLMELGGNGPQIRPPWPSLFCSELLKTCRKELEVYPDPKFYGAGESSFRGKLAKSLWVLCRYIQGWIQQLVVVQNIDEIDRGFDTETLHQSQVLLYA